MIVLHTVLLVGRLKHGSLLLRRLGQDVFDSFCSDMDASLREMGVGDLAVPRRMRGIGEAFYGRQTAYETALAAADSGQLVFALARNVFHTPQPTPNAKRLAAYVRQVRIWQPRMMLHWVEATSPFRAPKAYWRHPSPYVSRETNQERQD
jgi:cytochrome b pre-mRNA-processing protein 3